MGQSHTLIFYEEVIIIKNRQQKQREYNQRYGDIPLDYEARLNYMIDKYKLSEKKMDEIANIKYNIQHNLYFFECKVVQLLEIPEGASRPRLRVINKRNFNREAINSPFVHVYTPNARDDHNYMKKLTNEELIQLDYLINTPCIVEYDAYIKTPSYYSITETFLAEIGLQRPIAKPDWDNIGKKYCDMYNHNIWLDDLQVISGKVNKFYSILPRIEIKLKYLNCVYNKKQYNSIINRKDYDNGELHYLDTTGGLI